MKIKSMDRKGHENLKLLIPISAKIVLENLNINSTKDGVLFNYKYGRPLHFKDKKGKIVHTDWTSSVHVPIKAEDYRELIKPFIKEYA